MSTTTSCFGSRSHSPILHNVYEIFVNGFRSGWKFVVRPKIIFIYFVSFHFLFFFYFLFEVLEKVLGCLFKKGGLNYLKTQVIINNKPFRMVVLCFVLGCKTSHRWLGAEREHVPLPEETTQNERKKAKYKWLERQRKTILDDSPVCLSVLLPTSTKFVKMTIFSSRVRNETVETWRKWVITMKQLWILFL